MRVFFVEIPDGDLLWETEERLAIDGVALVPREGEVVWLPGQVRRRLVERIERHYGEDGGLVQIGIFVE